MANDIAAPQARLAPVVETPAGKLRGASAAGIHAFKGIPYGASTAGHNRFRPPQPPPSWAGLRDALAYAGHAPQSPNRPKRRPELETILGPADTTPEGEDCLTLNLWTPGLGDGAKRPVMVWLHGGAFAYGSGNRAVTEGANLARRGDVVVVSVNHRLNIFGFLHLADIAGPEWAHSGNAGSLDLVAALRWVRDNIAAFGGDPANVTIFGESGGGGKVSVLLAMPEARGLFHRAVVQSGAAVRDHDARARRGARRGGAERARHRPRHRIAAGCPARAAAGGNGAGLAQGRPHPLAAPRPLRFRARRRWRRPAAAAGRPRSPEDRRRHPADGRRHQGRERVFSRRRRCGLERHPRRGRVARPRRRGGRQRSRGAARRLCCGTAAGDTGRPADRRLDRHQFLGSHPACWPSATRRGAPQSICIRSSGRARRMAAGSRRIMRWTCRLSSTMSMCPTRPGAHPAPATSRQGFPTPGSPLPATATRTIGRSPPGPPIRARSGQRWCSTMIAVSPATPAAMPAWC